MRVLMAAGGTGGHLIPAVRIAEAVVRQRPDVEYLFVGSDKGFEERVISARGYRYIGLPARGLSRRRWWRNAGAVWNNVRAARMAARMVDGFHPDVAVGCGGYASYFPIRACARRRIPYVLQEQNRLPGLSTRWLSRQADATFVAFPETRNRLVRARRTECVGNPVDPRLATLDRATARKEWGLADDAHVVLVTGGSTGARSINRNILEGLRQANDGPPVTVLWQTGSQGLVNEPCGAPGWSVRSFAFSDRMTEAFVASDLIIARAGALTISEITAAGRAAILVPYPLATANHQTHNAQALVEVGGALLIEDARLSDTSLLEEARKLLADPARRAGMGEANRSLAHPEAADTIAAYVIRLGEHGSLIAVETRG